MRHGGDIYRNKIEYDFSVNINPYPYVLKDVFKEDELLDAISVYPDLKSAKLREAIAGRYSVDINDCICSNGASEAFLSICRALKPKRVLLLAPTFFGYEYPLQDAQIVRYYLKEEKDFILDEDYLEFVDEKLDMLFLGNPENPSGRLIDDKILFKILDKADANKVTVVLDESFYELAIGGIRKNTASLLSNYKNLIIVNGFSKTYAIPGLRLGFMFSANGKILKEVKGELSEWNVSTIAQTIGYKLALNEESLVVYSEFINKNREKLSKDLSGLNIKVYPSESNYLLIKSDKDLYRKLLDKKILIKDCAATEGLGNGYYRIAVRNEIENDVLTSAIRECI